ncbi:MAG: hypothetical protein K2W95_15695 [Candidatus Obscuribacterales bacterium]|nr:hypothetical protein [Candidatus Obscuribacterales bacterium]
MAKNKDKEAPALMPEDQSFEVQPVPAPEEAEFEPEVAATPEEKDPEVEPEPAALPEEMDTPEAVFQETPVEVGPENEPVKDQEPPVKDPEDEEDPPPSALPMERLRAAEAFKTSFRGVHLSFKSGDLIEDQEMGEFMLATGSPVHWVKETANYIECPKCKHSFIKE